MIQFTSRVDKIAGDLQTQITVGQLKPGQRLPSERSLCVTFGVGRTTIREALQSLTVRGLITRKGRSAIVADPANAAPRAVDLASLAARVNIKQLYEVRKLVEVKIAGWAATRATAEDIESIRRSIPAQEAQQGTGGSLNRSFHDTLAAAVHNPALLQIYESGSNLFFRLPFFWQLFDDSEVKTVRARRHEMARRWHQHILKAIELHDAAEAEGAMFQHLDLMEKDLLSRLRDPDNNSDIESFYSHPLLTELPAASREILEKTRLTK